MIGGLFLNTLSFIVTNQHVTVNNTPHVNSIVQQHHVVSATTIKSFHLEFSIAVLFVLFLALYRSTNFKVCVGVLMFKIVSMTLRWHCDNNCLSSKIYLLSILLVCQ